MRKAESGAWAAKFCQRTSRPGRFPHLPQPVRQGLWRSRNARSDATLHGSLKTKPAIDSDVVAKKTAQLGPAETLKMLQTEATRRWRAESNMYCDDITFVIVQMNLCSAAVSPVSM